MHHRDSVDAPGLLEVAAVWWDVERVPVVTWRPDGRTFVLIDPEDEDNVLTLAVLDEPPPAPRSIARVLAEGLAACDFPPSDTRASPRRVTATLRAAGHHEVVVEES